MCLWGNATDLSLLTHMTEEDIRNLQTVEKEAQAARSQFILKDDQDAAWDHVKSLKDARVDFVLDNSEFDDMGWDMKSLTHDRRWIRTVH
jgi:damage-control phosphatase, subfamily III